MNSFYSLLGLSLWVTVGCFSYIIISSHIIPHQLNRIYGKVYFFIFSLKYNFPPKHFVGLLFCYGCVCVCVWFPVELIFFNGYDSFDFSIYLIWGNFLEIIWICFSFGLLLAFPPFFSNTNTSRVYGLVRLNFRFNWIGREFKFFVLFFIDSQGTFYWTDGCDIKQDFRVQSYTNSSFVDEKKKQILYYMTCLLYMPTTHSEPSTEQTKRKRNSKQCLD